MLRHLQQVVEKNSLELKQISFLEVILIQIRKFNLPIKKENEIQILHLNFKIQLQRKSKFEICILFLKKWKQIKRFVYKGNLGDVTDQISTRSKKKSRKKTNIKLIFQISLKIEIPI